MEDRISNLPAHIIDDILSHLPLRDAVRTSLLSRQWRYKWTTLPHLVFNKESVLGGSRHDYSDTHLDDIVDHVILLHSGPIKKFKLSLRNLGIWSDLLYGGKVEEWILFLSRAESLEEFVFKNHVYNDGMYKLPSCFYSFHNLISLELFSCTLITHPSTFTGFRRLKTLHLRNITISQHEFEFLVTNCPLLKVLKLMLLEFGGFTHFNINASNLLYSEIIGFFEEINLENTFQLSEVFIALIIDPMYGQDIAHFTSGNMMVKFLALLPRLQKLKVGESFLKYLASGGKVPKRLPNPCIKLHYLSLHVNFEDTTECNAALCLITSSPNLRKLKILALRQPNEEHEIGGAILPNYLKELEDKNISQNCCEFTNLRLIKIHIRGCAREVNLIEFLLRNSPVLERMTIKHSSYIIGLKLLKEMINFHRASALAC